MKDEWKEIYIKDIGRVVTGNTPPRKRPELYGSHTIFIKPTDITKDKKYCYESEEYYSLEGFEKYKKSLIPKDSTCVVTIGSIGEKIIIAHEDLFLNQAMNAVIPNENFDKHFIYYLLKFNLFQLKTFDSGTASGRENVSKSSFSNIKVSCPVSKSTQQKIANILSAYDDLIENNTKRIELLEEQAQLIYEEWFVRMRFPNHKNTQIDAETGLPEGWTNTTLAEIAKINANSISSSFDEDIQYIDISSVSTKSIDHTTEYPIKEAPGRAKRIVTHGDIIWSCVRPNRKSYAVIWNPEENTIASTGFSVVSPTEVPTSFLYQVLGTEQFIAYLTNRATGAAYPAVKSIDFKEYDISLPPKPLIDKFDAHTKDYLDVIWNLKQQNQKLKEARDILLPRLMMGIIEV
ncbi:restriction endonuclease subunit S [Psychrobacter sp.]|uniref:restriction endonuclease subunit S n=1 Tax=Psychrobacter sp. TaxID=56811 RepID=UPI003F9850A1